MITKWWSLSDFQVLPQESLIRLWYHHFLDTHRRYYDVSVVNGTVAFLMKSAYVPSTVQRTRRPVFTVPSDVYNELLAPSELFGRVTFRAGRWDGCFRSHHVSTYVQLGCCVDPVALFTFLSGMYDVEHLAFIMTRHAPSGVCECCGEMSALVEHHWWSSEEEREQDMITKRRSHIQHYKQARMVCQSCNTFLVTSYDDYHILPEWDVQVGIVRRKKHESRLWRG